MDLEKKNILHYILSRNQYLTQQMYLKKRKSSLSVYLDPSKAFDTINHTILIKKTRILWNKGAAA